MNERLEEEEKRDIRYNIMEAEDVLHEIEQIEVALSQEQASADMRREGQATMLSGLGALARKYNKEAAILKRISEKTSTKDTSSQNEVHWQQKISESEETGRRARIVELAAMCQTASYVGFRTFSEDDPIVSASLSLLALVAKQPSVRMRHYEEADKFGLNVPIKCLRLALERTRTTPVNDTPVDDNHSKENCRTIEGLMSEQMSAELQRKGCLLLGALSDGDSSIARRITEEGGVRVMLEAADFYRFHSDVANWALWALFTLLGDYGPAKSVFVEEDGVSVVIRSLRNCGDVVEVVRHGFVLLFDLMRDQSEGPRLDVQRIRSSALKEGMHEAVVRGMQAFSDDMNIIMMGQALLVGTEYTGDIPEYDPLR